jgi:hypothetical protein
MEAVPDGEKMAMVGPKRRNILKSIVNISFSRFQNLKL